MWIYALVLVGVTVVALLQLNGLRNRVLPEVSPETLQAFADARQRMADDALTRAGLAESGLRVTHCSEYGWPQFTVHVADPETLQALTDEGTLRAAFADAVADARGEAVQGVGFNPQLGVLFSLEAG